MGLLTGLKFYYPCDETSGTRFDSGRGGLDLAETGSVISQAGALNLALNGTGNPVNHVKAAAFELDHRGHWATGFTVSGWINLNLGSKLDSHPICAMWTAGDTAYLLRNNANRFRFLASSDGSTAAAEAIWGVDSAEDVWVHVIAWHDPVADIIAISVDDGTPVTAVLTTGIFPNITEQFCLGCFATGTSVGTSGVDEVGGWARVLSSDERTTLFGNGTPPSFSTFTDGQEAANYNYYWRQRTRR